MDRSLLIAPSILSADFTRLGEAVAFMEAAGADLVHVDVMDGRFVPNLTIGPPVIKALKRVTKLPLDVHLMIDNADETVGWYLEAGADIVVVHAEACNHLHRIVQTIHEAGAQAGVALNPGTPADVLEAIIADLDYVLVMSVNPGFGGQAFIASAIDKVRDVAALARSKGARPRIAVDGGIDTRTAPLVVEAGADVLVAGSAVFCAADPAKAIHDIRTAAVSKLV
ncbi:MAG: ribulose-phosphate 3-epimerase [Actinomycetota bacterium]|nr:MAG: ribulose-phosphate [Actinomycetota bacterium]MDO8949723.1 ribulose-phosphate 3-epimerase [Actinomycetota bacterium]MDP3631330.1 ribulose-phosphate 3-epimerase [Actinomycetota bacterium]